MRLSSPFRGTTNGPARVTAVHPHFPRQREDGPQQHFTWMDGLRTAGAKALQARVGHLPWGWKGILEEHKKAQARGWLCRKCEDNDEHREMLRREEEAKEKEVEERKAMYKWKFEADKAAKEAKEAAARGAREREAEVRAAREPRGRHCYSTLTASSPLASNRMGLTVRSPLASGCPSVSHRQGLRPRALCVVQAGGEVDGVVVLSGSGGSFEMDDALESCHEGSQPVEVVALGDQSVEF